MPQSKERHAEYMREKRQGSQEGSQIKGSQPKGSQETVPASYVQGITRKFKSLPERPRFLTLPDGQVLDRLNQPEGHISNDLGMQFCNESSYNLKPRKKR